MSIKTTRLLSALLGLLGVAAIIWYAQQWHSAGGYSDDGLWRGTFDINGRGPFKLTALYVQGDVVAISEDARVLYRGNVELQGTSYNSSMEMFFMNANPFGQVRLDGHMPSGNEIVARFKTADTGDEGDLRMTMDEASYRQPSSLDKVMGSWILYRGYEITQLNIDEKGVIQGGNTNACEYSGRIEMIDKRHNAYRVKLALSSCHDRDGYLEGLAYLDSSVETDDTLHTYVFNDNWSSYMPVVRNNDTRTIDRREAPRALDS